MKQTSDYMKYYRNGVGVIVAALVLLMLGCTSKEAAPAQSKTAVVRSQKPAIYKGTGKIRWRLIVVSGWAKEIDAFLDGQGIPSIFEGSIVYGIYVPENRFAEAAKLLENSFSSKILEKYY